ncbi:ERF family protein [Nocardiopsis synnemataformans]|uniref:ERF family protein n=1 Tax=Nocardiopsis synnemataformans TaxID=61305 RepID=UPI003EB7C620
MTETTTPGVIHTKLIELMQTVGAIGKDDINTHHRYNFRGIDAVMKHVHAAQVKVGVTILPTVLSREVSSAGKMTVTSLEVRYRFTAIEDGSYTDIVVWGEAADAQDKSTSKAMSMALKYGLVQALMIPTEDIDDGDKDSPVVDRSQPAPPRERPATPEEREFVAQVEGLIDAAATTDELNRLWARVKEASEQGLTTANANSLTARMKQRARQLTAPANSAA